MNTHKILSFLASGLMTATAAATGGEAIPAFVSQIDAKAIAVVSDADFRVSTYRDGRLADPSPERRDLLTLILTGKVPVRAEIPVSNSVTSPPEVMAVSPDGRFVYVVERLGKRSGSMVQTRDLAPGRRVTAIDVADPSRPSVAGTVDAGPMMESVRVSPDGRHLAIAANDTEDAMVQIVPTRGGRLAAPQSFRLADLGIARRPGMPRGGIDVTMVDWHPSGRYLSLNLNTRNQVLFVELRETLEEGLQLLPWGAPVEVGRDPFVGRFTPDGGHFISADWGRDFAAKDLEGRLPSLSSRLSLVRLASVGTTGPAAQHVLVKSIESDRSSEGLAISRDGRHVATVNMRETAFAAESPRHTREASISYFRFDASRSTLTKIGDYPFVGLLPEGGSFDASGTHFMATVFEYAGGIPAAGLEVWRVSDAERSGLSYLGRIPMPHGAHHVEVIP